MNNIVDLDLNRLEERRKLKMSERDIRAIIIVSANHLNRKAEFIGWTNLLCIYGCIDEHRGKQLRKKLTSFRGSHIDRFTMFLGEICGAIAFDDFLNILYAVGHSDFANELESGRYGDTIGRLQAADVPHAKMIQSYYCKMKQHLDNGIFNRPKEYLVNLTNGLKGTIRDSNDAGIRQFNAEKLVAVYVLRLPQYPGHIERKEILDDMKTFFHEDGNAAAYDDARHLPPRIDPTSADIVYASKMSITEAIQGRFEDAERLALIAEYLGNFYKSSLAKILAFHDQQYIFRRQFMRTGEKEYLGRVLSTGDRGLRLIVDTVDHDDDVRCQWTRVMMLYKALSLLGIESDFRMTPSYPSPGHVDQGKKMLHHIQNENFHGIEHRREMIYSICMARANENTDIDNAMAYVDEAIRLSEMVEEFMPNERENLRQYKRFLKGRHLRVALCKWITSQSCTTYLYGLSVCVMFVAVLLWLIMC